MCCQRAAVGFYLSQGWHGYVRLSNYLTWVKTTEILIGCARKIISIAADIHILRMIESGLSYCIFKRFVVFNH